MTLPLQQEAMSQTALTRAIVQNLRNLVRLIPQNHTARPARLSDAMIPGDAMSTGRSSLAELRFNDGSLARIGEQAIFRFLTKTRNFKLSNGTLLLLIPPGRGVTGVQTPNATAAIRGSALFVRYIPNTDTTIVGALTDSKIEVFNQGASQSKVLQAGQMAVVVNDSIEHLYEFDLNTFYETSDMVQGLDLTQQDRAVNPDPAIMSVKAETAAAAAIQSPITGKGVIENPAFVQSPASSSQETPSNQSNRNDPPPNATPSSGGLSSVGVPSAGSTTNNPPLSQPSETDNPSAQPSGTNNSPVAPLAPDESPVTPPVLEESPVAPPVPDESPVTPPVPEESPVTPPVPDESPVTPPVLDNSPVTPPVLDNSPVTPPVPEESPVTPPVPDNSPAPSPVPEESPVTPPVPDNSPAPSPAT